MSADRELSDEEEAGRKALKALRRVRPKVYAARQYIDRDTQADLNVRIPFDVYFQDPFVEKSDPAYDFDEGFLVPWEPGLGDGPTSARFAVVDYDGATEELNEPARWDDKLDKFVDGDGKVLDRHNLGSPQFRQVNVWATLQNALDFFEGRFGLGRRIEWGFAGNRLIVVPHAGYGQNAFYDRESKSLQFYYFDSEADDARPRIYTCQSADIINHEFGHAVLDGLRPLYYESVFAETAAFHEFVGDISAILIAFRNNAFRTQVIEATGGDLEGDTPLSSLAEEFGKHIGEEQDYLRSALNKRKYDEVKNDQRQHWMSEVLTGAMFDIIRWLTKHHMDEGKSPAVAFWRTIQRMQCLAVQPLDLLPPVDVMFADYARAALRAEQIANPTDPDGYRSLMIDAFVRRGILSADEGAGLKKPVPIFERLDVDVFHDPLNIAASRANAYRFLDDNRRTLFIPFAADVVVSDLSSAHKYRLDGSRLPQQVLLQYVWSEDVLLEGEQFGRFAGETTTMLCGGTLALDVDGNCLDWVRKPGTLPLLETSRRLGDYDDEVKAGNDRLNAFRKALAARIAAGRIGGEAAGGAAGMLEGSIAPMRARKVDGMVRFELTPHFGIHSDEDEQMGERPWSISS